MYGRISFAPSAQLSPMVSGRACRTEFQNASGVWPVSVRPDWSVIVPEIITGSRWPDRLEQALDREDRRLAVQRVEDRLAEDEIGAAVEETAQALGVGRDQLVEGDVAEARIVDVGRDRRRLARRPEHAGDEARAVRRFRGELVGRLAGEPRRGEVELVRERFQPVVGERGRVRVERVGLDDVRARGEVLPVNRADELRLGEHEQVVRALEVDRRVGEARAAEVGFTEPVALDHRPHRAVEDQDPAVEERAKLVGLVRLHITRPSRRSGWGACESAVSRPAQGCLRARAGPENGKPVQLAQLKRVSLALAVFLSPGPLQRPGGARKLKRQIGADRKANFSLDPCQ